MEGRIIQCHIGRIYSMNSRNPIIIGRETMPIPSDPGLAGFVLYFQAFVKQGGDKIIQLRGRSSFQSPAHQSMNACLE